MAAAVPAAGAERGRATLPVTGAAERATPVQRSRSTIADRRLRDLSPRKLWGRDTSEPAGDKKSEGFFSRLFGSRRSGRKRKAGGKEAEEAQRPQPRTDPSQEEREAEQVTSRAPESEAVPVQEPKLKPVLEPMRPSSGSVRPPPPAEVVSDVVDRAADVVMDSERQESAATVAPARDVKEANPPLLKREESRPEEDGALVSPQQEDREEEREERRQRSPEVSGRPRYLLRTGSRSVSQGSEGPETADPPPPHTPPVQQSEPPPPVSVPDQDAPTEAAPDQKQQQDQEEEESPPVLRRRRGTAETSEDRPSQTRRSSGSQKPSWMEELQRTPPLDGSQVFSGHELRRTFVKEEAATDQEVQRTPSWVREEPRKTPPSSGHELRKTWIKEQPSTPPSAEDAKTTPPWVKELRKSSPPRAVEETPRTPPWVTEELQRSSGSGGGPSLSVPVRPARVRPARRPASSADPTFLSPSPAAAGFATGRSPLNLPSVQAGAEPRRRASALVFGGAEPVSPPDSGPRSLDSAVLLTADGSGQRRSAPAADPAVSTADGVRLGWGETPASSSGSSDRLSGAGGEQDGKEVDGAPQMPEDVRRVNGSSDSAGDVNVETAQGVTVMESDGEEPSSGRPESASSSGKASDRSGSKKSLAESLESIASDSGRCDDLVTPDENSRHSLNAMTPERPGVPAKPRKVSETDTTVGPADTAPQTPTQEGSRLSPVEATPTPEMGDVTPEFMKIHLHRVEAPAAMTTQVVVPKPKPRETPSKPVWQMAHAATKEEAKSDGKADTTMNTKMDDKVETKLEKKLHGLAGDVPEVVLIEKHSPRQPRSVSHSNQDDHSGSNVKPAPETPTTPKSPKPAPEVPARPVLSSAARTPESSRHCSLGRQSTQESEDSEPVVLRRRPPPSVAADSSPDSELLKVFKRRSLKTVSPDEQLPKFSTPAAPADDPLRVSTEERETERPRTELVTSSASPSEARSAWNQRSVSMPTGGPKSPVSEAGPPSIGPVVAESPSARPERPERPERPRKPVPPAQLRPSPSVPTAAAAAADSAPVVAETPRAKSAPDAARALSAASSAAGPSGEQRRATQLEEDGAPAADWLKLVRERREQREQREQQTMRKLGQKELIIEVRFAEI